MATVKFVQDFRQENGDLYINPITGDFEFVASDNYHIQDILQSFPGWWKNTPNTGAGLPNFLKGKVNTSAIESTIKLQLEADGYIVNKPFINIDTNGKLTVRPNASRINI